MHYEKASAELITFVSGCFIMTGKGGSGDHHGKLSSSDERLFYGNDRHYFAGRQ